MAEHEVTVEPSGVGYASAWKVSCTCGWRLICRRKGAAQEFADHHEVYGDG